MNKRYVLGVDIGGTNFRMGIVDDSFEMYGYEKHSVKAVLGDDMIENLIKAIKKYLEEHSEFKVERVQIGVPGQVAKNGSYVHSVPKVRGLEGVELGDIVTEGLGIPTRIVKDTNALLYHDLKAMNLDPDNDKTILGFYLGTGFGNAIYIDGKLHVGSHGVAAELGHVPLYEVEDICKCGAVGCVETRTCGAVLAKMAKEEFPGETIEDLFLKHLDDPRVTKFVLDSAIPLATEITLIDPDFCLLGGGVFSMPEWPREMMEAEVKRRTRHPLPADDLKFIYVEDAQANGVMGTAMLAHKALAQTTK